MDQVSPSSIPGHIMYVLDLFSSQATSTAHLATLKSQLSAVCSNDSREWEIMTKDGSLSVKRSCASVNVGVCVRVCELNLNMPHYPPSLQQTAVTAMYIQSRI